MLPVTPSVVYLRTQTNQHRQLVSALMRLLDRRLLHPGATTTQIINSYVTTHS